MQEGPFDPPEPPGVKPVSMRGFFWWIGVTAVGMILIVVAFFVPIPAFYALLPGPVEDVTTLVDIDKARSYSSEGSLFLTTVSVDPNVTFSEFVASWFDPNREIVDRSSFTAGQSSNQFRREQERQMQAS